MSDIVTGYAKRPSPFKDELDALMKKEKPTAIGKIVERFKGNIRRYVKENGPAMTEKAVTFNIIGGLVYELEIYPATICKVAVLEPVRKVFLKEGIDLEWTYDRSKLDGKLVFKW